MSIEIATTRSNLIMSRVIRAVTGEKASHCVLIIDDLWVVHSNFYGVHAEYIGDFLDVNELVDRVSYPASPERVMDTLSKYKRSGYDYGAMIYLGLALAARRLFPRFVPKQNLWQTTGMFMCTEFISQSVFGQEDSLLTPDRLMERLRAAQ